jgi:hypothetical protein
LEEIERGVMYGDHLESRDFSESFGAIESKEVEEQIAPASVTSTLSKGVLKEVNIELEHARWNVTNCGCLHCI